MHGYSQRRCHSHRNVKLSIIYYVFQATRKLIATQEVLLKDEITANIASLYMKKLQILITVIRLLSAHS